MFHDRIVSKNCDDLISLAHDNELSLLLGYEEMKSITKDIPECNLKRFLDFDLEEIYMYCAVNCIENPYIANYINSRKQLEDEENTNEGEEVSQYPPIFSYDESRNEEELFIQPISSIRSSKRVIKPTHDVKKKKKRRRSKGKRYHSQVMLLLLLLCLLLIMMIMIGKVMILVIILKIFLAPT